MKFGPYDSRAFEGMSMEGIPPWYEREVHGMIMAELRRNICFLSQEFGQVGLPVVLLMVS